MPVKTITLTGEAEILRKLEELIKEVPDRVGQAAKDEADLIMTVSKEEQVPVDEGILRASGYVLDPVVTADTITVEMGYSAPYAAAVHEIPPPGESNPEGAPSGRHATHRHGKWKFLEDPANERAPKILENIVKRASL